MKWLHEPPCKHCLLDDFEREHYCADCESVCSTKNLFGALGLYATLCVGGAVIWLTYFC